MILDLIKKNCNITQREIGKYIDAAVSLVNSYLDTYEKQNLIKKIKKTKKTVKYILTNKGNQIRNLLNIKYLKSSFEVYSNAKKNIITFFDQLIEKGFSRVLLYGAGDVARILLKVLKESEYSKLEILYVIDDDEEKQNSYLYHVRIMPNKIINEIKHDGIMISSYNHNMEIKERILKIGYSENRIIDFFK